MTSAAHPPTVSALPLGVNRPLWSVMIPVCNRTTFLKQALDSVLSQAKHDAAMQICIVDNSTTPIDWMSFLGEDSRRRIEIFRQPSHVPLFANWNSCIEQARGQLIHILHDDDWVLPGFYSYLAQLAEDHPDIALFAVRCFLVDPEANIDAVTQRLPVLEKGARDPAELFLVNHLQCPGIIVRRQAYEEYGGFSGACHSVLDWEMWCRIIGRAGGMVSPAVLACYRTPHASYYSNATRTARNLCDFEALYQLQRARFPHFPTQAADRNLLGLAHQQSDSFRRLNDAEAAAASAAFWAERAPIAARLRRAVGNALRMLRIRP